MFQACHNAEIREIQDSSDGIQRRDMNKLIIFPQAWRPMRKTDLQSVSQDPQSGPGPPATRHIQLGSIFVGQVSNLPEERRSLDGRKDADGLVRLYKPDRT